MKTGVIYAKKSSSKVILVLRELMSSCSDAIAISNQVWLSGFFVRIRPCLKEAVGHYEVGRIEEKQS